MQDALCCGADHRFAIIHHHCFQLPQKVGRPMGPTLSTPRPAYSPVALSYSRVRHLPPAQRAQISCLCGRQLVHTFGKTCSHCTHCAPQHYEATELFTHFARLHGQVKARHSDSLLLVCAVHRLLVQSGQQHARSWSTLSCSTLLVPVRPQAQAAGGVMVQGATGVAEAALWCLPAGNQAARGPRPCSAGLWEAHWQWCYGSWRPD